MELEGVIQIASGRLESFPLFKVKREQVSRYSFVLTISRELEVVSCKFKFASYVCLDQARSHRAFAEYFCNHSAYNVMAFSFCVGDDMVLAA